jgi:ACS family D-galactonate transporter-like MFS transporter
MFQGLVSTVGAFIGLRVALGVCEAPCFPANSRVLNSWFPQQERARATSIYSVGLSAGLAFLTVPLFWIAQHYTWRGLFIVAGGIGVLFGVVWYAFYREPRESTLVNQGELDYIAAGGGFAKVGIAQTPVSWSNIIKVSKLRPILIISLAQFCGNTVLTFFLIDFVNYLATQRHMAWIKLGFFLAFPFMAAAVGGLVGGAVADQIIKRGGSITFARKLPVASGLIMASSLVLANWVPDGQDNLVIAIMSVAFFGQGMSNLGWTVLTDLAPKNMLGLAGGFFNMITNLAGILTPFILGAILFAHLCRHHAALRGVPLHLRARRHQTSRSACGVVPHAGRSAATRQHPVRRPRDIERVLRPCARFESWRAAALSIRRLLDVPR